MELLTLTFPQQQNLRSGADNAIVGAKFQAQFRKFGA
jgi:hypothetical protein